MAEKKTKKKVTYNGKKYEVLEQNETMVKLTDGIIHFWVNKDATE